MNSTFTGLSTDTGSPHRIVFKHEIKGLKDGGDKNHVDENVSEHGSDHSFVEGPPSLYNSDLGYNDLKFRPLCSEIVTVDTFGGYYTQ